MVTRLGASSQSGGEYERPDDPSPVGGEPVHEVGHLDSEVGGLRPPPAVGGWGRSGSERRSRNGRPVCRVEEWFGRSSSAPLGRPERLHAGGCFTNGLPQTYPRSATRAVRRRISGRMRPLPSRVIKYLGSKRLLVPVLGEIAGRSGRARPWTCSPAPRGWPRSSRVAASRSRPPTWRRTARCSATATSPRTRPGRPPRAGRRAGPAQRAAGERRLRHAHVLRAGALLPAAQRPAHRRHPRRRSRATTRRGRCGRSCSPRCCSRPTGWTRRPGCRWPTSSSGRRARTATSSCRCPTSSTGRGTPSAAMRCGRWTSCRPVT